MLRMAEWWSSSYHCLQLISNQETPHHRDSMGYELGLDLLASFGNYRTAYLSIPTLGLDCSYGPGTLTALLGKVLVHGVARTDGERFCLAHFLRPNVYNAVLGTPYYLPPPTLNTIGNSRHQLSPREICVYSDIRLTDPRSWFCTWVPTPGERRGQINSAAGTVESPMSGLKPLVHDTLSLETISGLITPNDIKQESPGADGNGLPKTMAHPSFHD